jgi:hypothetical protein
MTENEQNDRERDDQLDAETDEEREELAQRGRLQQTEDEEEGPDEAA